MSKRTDTIVPLSSSPAAGLRAHLAEDLFGLIPEMTEDIGAPPEPDTETTAFVLRLATGPTPEDAITLMAHALRPQQAVWWAHQCLAALPDLLDDADRAGLALAAAWVAEPDDAHRYAALEAGQAASPRGPGTWLAIATGWSGGSMAPPDQPGIPAPAFLLGRALATAVLTTLARAPLDRRRPLLDHYLELGGAIARSC